MPSQLHEHYKKTVVEELVKTGKYTNRMQVPKVEKVVINMGVNSKHEKDVINEAQQELATIAGQRPIIRHAKKSIASFHVREGIAGEERTKFVGGAIDRAIGGRSIGVRSWPVQSRFDLCPPHGRSY